MSTAHPAVVPDLSTRRAPAYGAFNLTALQLEVRRLLRNRRTLIITLIFPVFFFLIFGLNKAYASDKIGHGNIAAFIMISLGLYGAVAATMFGGAMVSIERAQGWSRQLRLTPLAPAAYISMKVLTSLILGAGSLAVVYIAGLLTHKASMPAYIWVATGFSVWIGSLLFAALGLFLGYLLPTENVMQLMSLVLTLLSFGGGLFIPISQFPQTVQDVAKWTPLYGLNQLVHTPLLGNGVDWTWVVNVVFWLAIFVGGAVWRFRMDTARV
ncbi:MAG TPA: ABC transporter permease [Streptosporangiaceae bacterium]|jgi:ABC-2 type transport system permease protein|nr:ABC transporter permease [Streptosporangiaceae bacterium]